jgi:hypothetical protein
MDLSEYGRGRLPGKDEEFALYRGHARRLETPSVPDYAQKRPRRGGMS